MDQLAAPSPFSTRESRDKYIRPPLTNYDSDFNDSTVVEQETAASSSSSKKSNRRSRGGGASSVSVPASVYSPPISSTFATSSPAREGDNLKTLTPGLSMIQGSSPMSDKPVKRITRSLFQPLSCSLLMTVLLLLFHPIFFQDKKFEKRS